MELTSNSHHLANRVHINDPGPAGQNSGTAVRRFRLLGRECGLAATKCRPRPASSATISSFALRRAAGLFGEKFLQVRNKLLIGCVTESG